MDFSAYNIISKVKDSENWYIVNLLSGNADIIEALEAKEVINAFNIKNVNLLSDSQLALCTEKGYIVDLEAEKKLYKTKYLNFIDSRDNDEIQIFFVPNYTCNFACSYCYQDEYAPLKSELKNELIDAFFNYITTKFAGRKKYVTIFGGEPLLLSNLQNIQYIIKKANEHTIELAFVTNGYTLIEYIDILKTASIREIQVTLDGTEEIHNSRRFLKGGQKTFETITKGIDACLSNNIAVNLRMVVDKENIENLPELAQFAINKGWTNNPLFKTQIGRNYELHHCQSTPDKLFNRIDLYENIYQITKRYPHIGTFYQPPYSISKYLFENGQLPDPLFDSCPACKTEWAFDYTGKIYSCTATVGKADEVLGSFYPINTLDIDLVDSWEQRDITTIADCKTCTVQHACGGGCGSIAKNKNGSIHSTDCRPIKELLELGMKQYFE